MYAVGFGDAGLSPAQISSLFLIWSITGFVFEVPSGAWADVVDRRRLLVASAVVLAAAFTCWTVAPGYGGFAVGFALWGLSGAMASGTFESLLYDALAVDGRTDQYARIDGWANAAGLASVLAATVAGGALLALGGFTLVGVASIAVAAIHAVAALSLPSPPRSLGDDDRSDDGRPGRSRYVARLREGLAEAGRDVAVRGAITVSALVIGLSAYDEYIPLVAAERGVPAPAVPLVVAVVVAGQIAGTVLAGRTAAMRPRTVGVVVAVAAGAVSAGAWQGGWAGFVILAVGYGMLNNAMVVSEARLQTVISGRARATVTSTAGLATEVVALGVYGFFTIGSPWLSTATLVVALGLPTLGVALATARLLPPAGRGGPAPSGGSEGLARERPAANPPVR